MNKLQLLKSLKTKGFSKEIVHAFSKVNREDFLSKSMKDRAYEDTALPIGNSQTISQPYTIAVMLSELQIKKGQRILEVGSGSGYVLALISELVGEKGKVFGIERIKEFVQNSKKTLKNYKNIEIYNKNGAKGLEEKAPFDKILMSATCREIPQSLLNQLKEKGILVAPLGSGFEQNIVTIQKTGNSFMTLKKIPGFVFVPFIEQDF